VTSTANIFTDTDAVPVARVLESSEIGPFLAVDLSAACSVILPGAGSVAAGYARKLAAELLTAADAVERAPMPAPAPSVAVSEYFL
jgi:hypothetical protein